MDIFVCAYFLLFEASLHLHSFVFFFENTSVGCTCLLFIRSGHNYLARHSGREEKIKQTEEEVERQPQEVDRPGVQALEDSGEHRKMEKNWFSVCEDICGASNNPCG